MVRLGGGGAVSAANFQATVAVSSPTSVMPKVVAANQGAQTQIVKLVKTPQGTVTVSLLS